MALGQTLPHLRGLIQRNDGPGSGKPNVAMRLPAINLPNTLTMLRLAMAPAIAWLLLQRHDVAALELFAFSALSDWLDGRIARRWHEETRFGAVLDPIADKTTGAMVVVVLAWQGDLPPWFALAALARDAVIVTGALAYRLAIGRVEMAPTMLSKANTALLFVLLLGLLAARTGALRGGSWLEGLQLVTTATIFLSGAQYVLVWGRKAWAGWSWRH